MLALAQVLRPDRMLPMLGPIPLIMHNKQREEM